MRENKHWDLSNDNPSLQQVLAEICDVDVSLLSACTAPAALKREFAIVPDEAVIAVVSRVESIDRRNEIEGALLLYTSWRILQRVQIAGKDIALLLVPAV